MTKLNIRNINQLDFPENQYYQEKTDKSQIVLHHTVSGDTINGDYVYWKSTKERIATCVILARYGSNNIYQLFSSGNFAHHIGCRSSFLKEQGFIDYNTRNLELNKHSIGVEIDSWGGLVQDTNRKFYPAVWDNQTKSYVPNRRVKAITNYRILSTPFRGFYAYEQYTHEQIESLRQLLVYWNDRYGIPLDYKTDMWDVSKRALSGEAGIWAHVSYRPDKSDIYPDIDLIQMLKGLQ